MAMSALAADSVYGAVGIRGRRSDMANVDNEMRTRLALLLLLLLLVTAQCARRTIDYY